MTTLPEHRRIVYGRTYGRAWSPADMDPIRRYTRPTSPAERAAGVLLGVVLGIVGAVMLVSWWSA